MTESPVMYEARNTWAKCHGRHAVLCRSRKSKGGSLRRRKRQTRTQYTPPLLQDTSGLRGEPETAKYGATLVTHGTLALSLAGCTEPPPEPGARPLLPTAPFPPLYSRLAPFSPAVPSGLGSRTRRLRLPLRQPRRASVLTFLSRSMRTLLFPPLSKLRRLSSARKSITRSSLSRRRFSDSELETPDPPKDADSPCPAAN